MRNVKNSKKISLSRNEDVKLCTVVNKMSDVEINKKIILTVIKNKDYSGNLKSYLILDPMLCFFH